MGSSPDIAIDLALYVKFVLALVFVIILILAATWGIKKLYRFSGTMRGNGRRLAIIEVQPVDTRRRLVLVRRDNREHLLLIGGETDIVVERDIRPFQGMVALEQERAQDTRTGDARSADREPT
jgi:flagellar protein FliO/FliZ